MTTTDSIKREAGARAKSPLPGQLCNLPLFRPAAVKMLKLLSRENTDFSEITRILECDPGFSAEVLTLANSSLYGGYCQINTVLRAVVVLGAERIKSLTMTTAMREFLRNLPQTPELHACWSHSRACALMAEELAPAFRVARDQAYTAGLMHDVGRFGLLAGCGKDYATLLARGFDTPAALLEAERENFGFDHCEAGARLEETWRLPAELAEATEAHHLDLPQASTLGTLVRAACLLASAFGFPTIRYREAPEPEEIAAGLPGRPHRLDNLQLRLQEKFYSLDLA